MFHTGFAVTNLESAMEEIGATGLTWRDVISYGSFEVWTERGVRSVSPRRVYSVQGPPYVELVEDLRGDVWAPLGPAGVPHLGFWADDVRESCVHLEAAGLHIAVSDNVPPGIEPRFVYFRTSSGPLIELLPRSRRAQILN